MKDDAITRIEDRLDAAVRALAQRKPPRSGHTPHAYIEACERVTTLASVLAYVVNGGVVGYAPFLADSTERVFGERVSHVRLIVGLLHGKG